MTGRNRVARSFDRHAGTYEKYAQVQAETADRLAAELAESDAAGRVIDVGCGSGRLAAALAAEGRFTVTGCDLAPAMARLACRSVPSVAGDATRLPFAGGTFDLAASNLMLQWVEDPAAVFDELARVLVPGGRLLIATLGPATFGEIRAAMGSAADRLGVDLGPAPFVRFAGIDGLRRAAVRFDLTAETATLHKTYPDVPTLLRALKRVGAQNAEGLARLGLGRRRLMAAFMAEYEARFAAPGGIGITYEVVTLRGVRRD